MTLEELIAALGLDETNAAVLKKFVEDKDATATKKYGTLDKKLKDALKSKENTDRLNEIIQSFKDLFEVEFEDDAEIDAIETVIEEAKKKLETPPKDGDDSAAELTKLKRDFAKLERELKREQTKAETLDQSLTEERTKRHTSMKMQALQSELLKSNIKKPELLQKLFLNDIKVNDDDSLSFINGDEELTIAEAIQAWAKDNPEFVDCNQKPGAGGQGGGAGGQGKINPIVEGLIKNNTNNDKDSGEILNKYFGN